MQWQGARVDRLWRWLLFVGSCAFCLGLLYFRRPDAFTNPQFYAEDGRDFFAQAYADGWRSLFYRTTGYHVLYGRLIDIAGLAFGVPLVHMPMVHTAACIAAYMMVWLVIFLRFPAPLAGRAFAVLTTTLLPLGNEIWMNTTALQWPMALLLPLLCWGKPPRGIGGRVLTVVALLLVSFTGPFALLMLPVLACQQLICGVRSIRQVPWTIWVVLIAALITSVQLMRYGGVLRSEGSFNIADAGFVQMVFKQLWFPILAQHVAFIPTLIAAGLVIAAAGASTWHLWETSPSQRGFVWSCVVGAAVVVIVTLISFRNAPGTLSPYGIGTRYFYLPAVFIVWSILARIERYDRLRCTIVGAVGCWWCWTTFATVGRLTFIDHGWPFYAEVLQNADSPMVIPITPTGWIMYVSKEDATTWPVPWAPEP